MVADFPELHHCVLQGLASDLAALGIALHDAVVVDALVDDALPGTQVNLDYVFNLVGQLFFHFLFDASEEERSQDLVQSVDDQELFFF